ncbi:glycosyltransferase [Actinoplanes palleronii]|uniref:Glycosyltransferase involved in cell wall biosynthesis n=1 Tax=Actinoplanes palleronii TaxID=113570 RepID=A0ABQ4BE90_9ACTN|nr:glycosyltransferase [Actinoplanes palleronii]GIE68560.1 hypothetical protein Apa02nite_046680 [Actinoplanes palleronii]
MADLSPTRLKTIPESVAAPPIVSVVVPTRNEAENVGPLVERLRAALGAIPAEIVFVDDSDDETPRVITEIHDQNPALVRLVHRPAGARPGGLGGAVAAGLATARAEWVVVMDGDLQHPPETVPELLAAGQVDQAEAVVASRYRTRGRVDGLSGAFRRSVSRATGTLARLVFPVRLRAVTDPMSGFFAVRRDRVRTAELRPQGYKILLEVLVRSRIRQVAEVPYTFQPRHAGESKASFREGLRYLRQLAVLRLAAMRRPDSALGRLAGFAAAGALGTAVNSAALWAFGEAAGLPYLLAAFLAVQVAIVGNFAIVDRLVMHPGERTTSRRFGRFLLLNNTLTPIHLGLLYALVQLGGLHYLSANLVAIVVVFALRYAVTSAWVYGIPTGGGADARRLFGAVRRAVQTRITLAVVLTAVACPALLSITWNGLWSRGPGVSLLIPLAAAAALIAGRVRPAPDEPDVHDRQTDGLLATGFLAAAATLLLVMPAPDRTGWLVPAACAYLAGAAVLLVGTRTAARLRWALLLPVVAIGGLLPASTVDAVNGGLRAVVAVLGRPAGPVDSGGALVTTYEKASLTLPSADLPGTALLGGAACLLICALVISGARPVALGRAVLASVVLAAVTVGALLAVLLTGRLLGPAAFRVAALPVTVDLLLTAVVVIFVARWSRRAPQPAPMAVRPYLPRARFALVALVAVAVLLGLQSLPAALSLAGPAPSPAEVAPSLTEAVR